jgi:hypothetical protein
VSVSRTTTSQALVLVLVGLSCAVVGCGDSGLPLVQVHGTVTFAGGPPPKPGNVTFTPIAVEAGLPNRPGSAVFDTDGRFQVTSFRENDGLVPGTYHANVSCWMGAPSSSDPSSFERLNYVPSGFKSAPIVVKADADSVEVKIDVPKKK